MKKEIYKLLAVFGLGSLYAYLFVLFADTVWKALLMVGIAVIIGSLWIYSVMKG